MYIHVHIYIYMYLVYTSQWKVPDGKIAFPSGDPLGECPLHIGESPLGRVHSPVGTSIGQCPLHNGGTRHWGMNTPQRGLPTGVSYVIRMGIHADNLGRHVNGMHTHGKFTDAHVNATGTYKSRKTTTLGDQDHL